jgi:acetyl esterase/lipase
MTTPPQVFKAFCVSQGLPAPVEEFAFAKAEGRKWRFDYAWPDHKIALEVHGGAWVNGGHNRGSGFLRDMVKFRRAGCLGWKVISYTPQELMRIQTIADVKEAIQNKG